MCEQPTLDLGDAPLVSFDFGDCSTGSSAPWLIIAIGEAAHPAISHPSKTTLAVPNCPDVLDRSYTCGLQENVEVEQPKFVSNSHTWKAPRIFMGRPTTEKDSCNPMTRGLTPDLPA